MATQNWETPAGIVTYLDTALNALADGANKLGAAINNETGLYLFTDLELFVQTQGGARSAGAFVAAHFLPSIDGTNFDMGADAVDPADDSFVVLFALDAATTARYRTKWNIPLGPFQYKILLINETGQAFAGTLTTLKYRLHNGQIS